MATKRGKSRSFTSTPAGNRSASRSAAAVAAFELSRFCCKKLFQVVLANETSVEAGGVLGAVLDAARKYEHLCRMTVVTYDDVIGFVNECRDQPEQVCLPADVRLVLPEITGEAAPLLSKDQPLQPATMAKLVKLKLIHTMYRQYSDRVAKMEAFARLDDELKTLARDKSAPVATKKTGGKAPATKGLPKADTGKKNDADLTEVELEVNPLLSTDGFENEVWFYILSGFFDANLLPALAPWNVPIDIVIEISANFNESPEADQGDRSPASLSGENSLDGAVSKGTQRVCEGTRGEVRKDTHTVSYSLKDLQPSEGKCENATAGNEVTGQEKVITGFWSRLDELMFGSSRSEQLEKTVLMRYGIGKGAPGIRDGKTVLEELFDVMSTIYDLKLDHLTYIRNLKLGKLPHTPDDRPQFPADFRLYSKMLEAFPSECVDVPVILECLLEEMCQKLGCPPPPPNNAQILEDIISKVDASGDAVAHQIDCECPFSFDYFVKRKRGEKGGTGAKVADNKNAMPYQIHEQNELEKLLRAYKAVGRTVYDINLKYLRQMPPASFLASYDTDDTADYKHTHDRAQSGCTVSEFTDEEVVHYIVSLSLFRLQCPAGPPRLGPSCRLTERLRMREPARHHDLVRPAVVREEVRAASRSRHRRPCPLNLYEVRLLSNCGWSEILPGALLLQQTALSNETFCCRDHVFCDEIGSLLVRYHDGFDRFGVRTTVWSRAVRTPVCLRDFCRYVCRDEIELILKQHPEEETDCDSRASGTKLPADPMFCEGLSAQLATVPLYNDYLQFLPSKTDAAEHEDSAVDAKSRERLAKVLDYGKVGALQEECVKEGEFYSHVAYDLGPRRVEVAGSTTVFQSHDGVRIAVDTTHFVGSEKNLSLKVSSNGNDLIMHRTAEKHSCLLRYVTSDGTSVAVDKALPEQELGPSQDAAAVSASSSFLTGAAAAAYCAQAGKAAAAAGGLSHGLRDSASASVREGSDGDAATLLADSFRGSAGARERRSRIMSEGRLGSLGELQRDLFLQRYQLAAPNLDAETDDSELKRFAADPGAYRVKTASEDILNAISCAVDEDVNDSARMFKFRAARRGGGAKRTVWKRGGELRVPMFAVVKRLLYRQARLEKCKRYVRRYVPRSVRPAATPTTTTTTTATGGGGGGHGHRSQVRVQLPHGLHVALVASEVSPGQTEVKQSYRPGTHPARVHSETYRLFTRNGIVLIRYPDGRIDLLRSNGEIVQYERPCNGRQSVVDVKHGVAVVNCFRPPRCKTLRDCQKQAAALMAARHPDDGRNFVSRRARFHTQRAVVYAEAATEADEELRAKTPYLRQSVLHFEGERTTVDGENRVTKKHECFLTHEFDHRREERLYMRDDGMRCLLTRDGVLTVRFPDNSRTTSWFEIDAEPVVINRTMGGWVSVTMVFRFEHTDYATVTYTTATGELEMVPNAAIKLKQLAGDTYSLELCDNVAMDIADGTVHYRKSCPDCGSSFQCDVDMARFADGGRRGDADILVARDSYNKVFRVRDVERCTTNANYITGPSNINGCDHYSRMVYERLYAVRRDGSGLRLWCTKNVQAKMREFERDPRCEVVARPDVHGFNTLEFLRGVTQHYGERFSHGHLEQCELTLSRYRGAAKPADVVYVTYRELYEMTNMQKLNTLLSEVKEFILANGNVEDSRCRDLLHLTDELLHNTEDTEFLKHFDFSSTTTESVEEKPPCECVKLKFTYQEKTDHWRRQCQKYRHYINKSLVPSYFKSEYYKPLADETNKL